MHNTKINYGLICLLISLMYGLVPLIEASKPIIAKPQQSLTQLKIKDQLTSTAGPDPKETASYKNEILHETSKSINLAEGEEAENPFRFLNEWKQDSSNYFPSNSFDQTQQTPIPLPLSFPHFPIPMIEPYSSFAAMSQSSKMFNFFGYPQPIFIPYHIGMTPEMLYAHFAENNNNNYPISEDYMSRSRRPTNSSPNFQRNSPIYYVRLPPTPYMFLPSFNYPTATSSSINPYMPYPSLSNFHVLPMSSVFNLPMNFLANGKPNGIYRIDGSSNNIQHERFPYAESQPNLLSNTFRPITSTLSPHLPPPPSSSSPNYLTQHQSHPFAFRSPTPSTMPQTSENKLASSKRPYVFNGRAEDIYILPNNFNSIYSEGNSY